MASRPPAHPAALHASAVDTERIRPHVEVLRCPPAPPKSSRERGRAYRARRKQQEHETTERIAALTEEIEALRLQKTLVEGTTLQQRHTIGGSLCRFVEMYFELFSHGYCDRQKSPSSTAATQRAFIMRSYDKAVSLGIDDQVGPLALLNQWRLYTAAHRKFHPTLVAIAIHGPSDDPTVVATTRIVTGLTRSTFEILFPHVRFDWGLQARLVGTDVVYEATTRFRFTETDRICSEHFEIDFIRGLQLAGVPLADVAVLMQTPALSRAHTIATPRRWCEL